MRLAHHCERIKVKDIRLAKNETVFIRGILVSAKHEIAKRIDDLLSFIGLRLLDDMGVMPDHKVRALVDAIVGDGPLWALL